MKILYIYPNALGYGRVPIGPAILITILMKKGHQLELFDTTFILQSENIDSSIREKSKVVKMTDTSGLYNPHTEREVGEMLREKVRTFFPDLVAISIQEDSYKLGTYLLEIVKSVNKNIPVVAGGVTPTVVPEIVIKNPYIDYVISGEGEEALEELCDLLEMDKPVTKVGNLCFLKGDSIIKNPVRPFASMDNLPIQNLDLWDKNHFVKPYDGEVYKAGYFELSRGCMFKCTYCVNETYQRLLADAGKFFRRKAIEKSMIEIKTLKKKFNFNMIYFCDDNFLSMNPQRIEEFSKAWKKDVNLPFWINTAIESINPKRLSFLKEAGCVGIGIGIESGSEWLRRNVLGRSVDNRIIIKGFQMIHDHGIRTTANIMVGFPGEYEEDIFETIKLVKEIHPNSWGISFVAPYIGTPIHTISKKLDYIEILDESGFEGMSKEISFRGHSVINAPHISREKVKDFYYSFTDYIQGAKSIPKEYLKHAPGANESAPPRGDLSKDVVDAISEIETADAKEMSY
jgi:anaerobic magnesium-protoporphyrin IX monomethyl ester cyclase